MIKKESKAIAAQATKPNGIELAAFRFNADANGETHFTVEEGRWLRDTLHTLLTHSEETNGPTSLSFDRSLYAYVYDKAITRREFHDNAERLLVEYGLHSTQSSGVGSPTIN